MNTTMKVKSITMKGEFIPTFGTVIDGVGTVNTALVRVRTTDLKFLPTKANPRSYNERGTTTKKIADTLINEPELFEVLNRGLTIVCSDCTYKSGNVIFTFTDETQGLVDGGHSFYTAMKNQSKNAKVIIKVIYNNGAEELASRISETFNTTEKVKEMSLNNLRGYFDFVKKQLINEPFYFEVKWEENSKKRISCNRIIGLLNSFDPDRWGHGDISEKAPTDSYNSSRHTQLDYAKMYEKYGETPENPYYALKNVITDIINLFDYVERNFITLYNKVGRYKNLSVTLPDKTKISLIDIDKDKKQNSTFSNEPLSDDYVPTSLIYAIISPMRIFMERDKDGFWYFNSNPISIFEKIGPQLIKYALTYYTIWNINAAMKDPKFWVYLYDKTILLKNKMQ